MPAIAITGTIGSGKSTALHALSSQLSSLLGAASFCADEENRLLLDHDQEVKNLITSHFGAACYQPDGCADKKFLFTLIQHDPGARSVLESILHPRLEALWRPLAEKFRKSHSSYFLAEIPLLYEKQLEVFFDRVIVVGCSDSVRRERLQRSRSLPPSETVAWLAMQSSQDKKVIKSDYLLWNDGSKDQLLWQTNHLASQFLKQ